jgi:hypothetical protein
MLITLTYPLYKELAHKEKTFGNVSAHPSSLGGFLNEIEYRAKGWYFKWHKDLRVATECSFCQVPFVHDEYTLYAKHTDSGVKQTACLECCIQMFVPDLIVPDSLISKEAVSDGGDSRTVD